MGEELELIDVNGNRVTVALHTALYALVEVLRDRLPYEASTKNSGEWVKIQLVQD